MKKSKKQINYLDLVPTRNKDIKYETDNNGIVTVIIENTGFVNKLTQKLFKRPKYSYVHLDEYGSNLFNLIDGVSTIEEISKKQKEKFGDKVEPLYPRSVKFFQMLNMSGFIEVKEKEGN